MKLMSFLLLLLLNMFQVTTTNTLDTEFDPVEIYNFVLIFFGIILLIVILVYILLTSKQEQ